jgi:hypothetical protein
MLNELEEDIKTVFGVESVNALCEQLLDLVYFDDENQNPVIEGTNLQILTPSKDGSGLFAALYRKYIEFTEEMNASLSSVSDIKEIHLIEAIDGEGEDAYGVVSWLGDDDDEDDEDSGECFSAEGTITIDIDMQEKTIKKDKFLFIDYVNEILHIHFCGGSIASVAGVHRIDITWACGGSADRRRSTPITRCERKRWAS